MDTYDPRPPKPNAAECETMTEERKTKPWSKPVIRHIGQTIYTATGPTSKPGEVENNMYQAPSS